MPRARGGGMPPVRKSLGQHFLTDRRILARIADALEPMAGRTVVEIGPGRGSLTELLEDRAGRVVAIEYDRMLAERLRQRFGDSGRVTVVQADVLEVDLAREAGGAFLLVGNVPYYITTPILFHALQAPRPDRAVYMVQREVAERLAAAAGDRNYGALSVNVQAVAQVELLFSVAAGSFSPPPRVESAVVRLVPLAQPVVQPREEQPFREMVQRVFGFRRKQMRRVLRELTGMPAGEADTVLERAGISGEARPETLDPTAFAALLRALPP